MRPLWSLLLLLACTHTPAQPAARVPVPVAEPSPPSLIADSGRSTRGFLGGEGQALKIESSILDETRRINLVLPSSYSKSAATRRYPVAIVLDGEADLPAAAAVSDELSRWGHIPELLIVAIENTDRIRDLTPPGLSVSGSSTHEGGDRFLDFIEHELLPAVDRQFRGSEPRVLIGHSSGGILATYAAATRSTYRAVIALDTPIHLGENWLAQQLTAAASEVGAARGDGAARSALRYVSYEARFAWPEDAWSQLTAAAPASWRLHRERLPMESHESIFMLGAYLALQQVFSDYSMRAAPVSPTTSTLPYYEQVGESLGAAVIPPRPLLVNVVEDLLMEGRGAEAHAAYDLLELGYGRPPDADELRARIAEAESRPPPSETVEGLLATPFPTPEEAAAYLGEWIGDVWMNPDELYEGRPRHHLRLTVVDGKVQGEVENEPAPGETMVSPITYLKITPTGMTYGFMNGMRPRGMLLFEGELKDGTLSGEMRFGGIDFEYPEDMVPPVISFAYTKVR